MIAGEPLYHRYAAPGTPGSKPFALIMDAGDVIPLHYEPAGVIVGKTVNAILATFKGSERLVGIEHDGKIYWTSERSMKALVDNLGDPPPQVKLLNEKQ